MAGATALRPRSPAGSGLNPIERLMRGAALAEVLVGLGVAALGGFIAIESSAIDVSPAYAKVGPQAIPYIVAAGLILFGLLFAGMSLRPKAAEAAPATTEPADWLALAVISAGLIAQMLLLVPAGFVIASAILFYCVAFGFGSRRILRDGVIAVLLALVVYIGFTRGLDLQLPAGVLAGVL
jgi:putative tricarboxylic transport membrane protein